LVATRQRAPRQTGFTLLELLVVLAIAGLLVTMARPLYTAAIPGARLRAEVHDLAVTLRDARNRAVNGSRIIEVRLDTEAGHYAVGDDPVVDLSAGTAMHASLSQGLLDTDRPAYAGESDPAFTVSFYPDGSSSGGTIRLGNSAGTFRVDVDWLTGRITAGEADDDVS